MSTSFADRKKAASPAEATVTLCLDLRLHDQLRTAHVELRRREMAAAREAKADSALLDDQPRQPDQADSALLDDQPRQPDQAVTQQLWVVDEIEAKLEDHSEPYVFRALPRHKWDALGEEHPATEGQIAEVKRLNAEARESAAEGETPRLIPLPKVNQDTFWPAAVARCSHDPKLTIEDALWLRDGDDSDDDDDRWPGLPPTEWNRIVGELQQLHGTGVVVPKELLAIARAARHERNGTTPAPAASPSRSSAAGSRKTTKRTG